MAEFSVNQVVLLIIVLLALAVVVIFTTGSLGTSTNSIFEQTDQSNLCNAWLMGGCKIIDPFYGNLSEARICEACPQPANAASMDLTELEVAMKITCGKEDGEWTKCRNLCNCPPDNTYMKGCGAKRCDSFGNDCPSDKMCYCRTTGCQCVDADYCKTGGAT